MKREKKFTLKSYLELRVNISSNLLQGAMTYDEDMYNYYLGMWKIIENKITNSEKLNIYEKCANDKISIYKYYENNNFIIRDFYRSLLRELDELYLKLKSYEDKYYDKLICNKEVKK